MDNSFNDKDFEDFYSRYSTWVLNVAMHYLQDEYLAEDVMQEVMFKAYISKNDMEIQSESAWLTRITRNLSLNILKKMRYECTSDEIDIISDMRKTVETEQLNVETVYFREKYEKELSELCEDVFRELTRKKYERWYEAVEALYQGEEKGKETAKRLNMSESAFYAMSTRLRNRMKKLYGSRYTDIEQA